MARTREDATALPSSGSGVPTALRGHRPGWRDPRLWIGVVVVATSVLIGQRTLAAADDTVQVWTAATDLGAGERLDAEDLIAQRVRFADPSALDAYFTVDDEIPAELELTRTVSAGELVPRTAAGSSAGAGLVEVPVAVDPELVPPSVGPGDVVDVYVVAPAPPDSPSPTGGGPALEAVTVLAAPDVAATFGTTGRRQLVLAVPEDQAPAFFALLATYDVPSLAVVRRG